MIRAVVEAPPRCWDERWGDSKSTQNDGEQTLVLLSRMSAAIHSAQFAVRFD